MRPQVVAQLEAAAAEKAAKQAEIDAAMAAKQAEEQAVADALRHKQEHERRMTPHGEQWGRMRMLQTLHDAAW